MKPKGKHLLKTALHTDSTLQRDLKSGIGALSQVDARLIAESERTKVGDSVDLDSSMKREFPDANRWDYIISLPTQSKIVGLEPHTARDSEISVVIAKKKHALQYLRSHFRDGYHVAKWFWISHGSVSFSKMDRAYRLLNQNGIAFAGRLLRKFD